MAWITYDAWFYPLKTPGHFNQAVQQTLPMLFKAQRDERGLLIYICMCVCAHSRARVCLGVGVARALVCVGVCETEREPRGLTALAVITRWIEC